MNVMFIGTPDFAIPCLNALYYRHNVTCVVTKPDRPSGRGHKMTSPPVAEWAREHDIPVYQPESLKNGELSDALDQPRILSQ